MEVRLNQQTGKKHNKLTSYLHRDGRAMERKNMDTCAFISVQR